MAQTTTLETSEEFEAVLEETSIVKVWVAKANRWYDIDLSQDKLPRNSYLKVIYDGLHKNISKNMTKILTKGLEDEELEEAQEAAHAQVEKNIEELYSGQVKVPGMKKTKEKTGKIRTRARQYARLIVKAQIKAEGDKVSNYTAAQITEAADELIELNPELMEKARKELAEEDKQLEKMAGSGIKITAAKGGKLKADPKRVKANAERAARAKVNAKQRKEQRANA